MTSIDNLKTLLLTFQDDVEDTKMEMKQMAEDIRNLLLSDEKQSKEIEIYKEKQTFLEEKNVKLEEKLKILEEQMKSILIKENNFEIKEEQMEKNRRFRKNQDVMMSRDNERTRGSNVNGRGRFMKNNQSFEDNDDDDDDDNDDGIKSSRSSYGQDGRGQSGRSSSRSNFHDDFRQRGQGRGGILPRMRGFQKDGKNFNSGRNGARSNIDNDGNVSGEKKEFINKEVYIPPEPEQDEEKIFAKRIIAGKHFQKDIKDIKIIEIINVLSPIESFDDAKLHQNLLNNIKKSNYATPSPIQKYSIPTVLKGLDLMACAQTGSGKTAAFVIPIIHKLLSEPWDLVSGNHCEPQCLVIAPTRELAIQITDEFRKFANQSILKIEAVYGGAAVGYQAKRLSNGCHIVVGTEGRLNDFISRGRIKLHSIRYLVLDEADRMLDSGFMPGVEKIMDHETMVSKEQRQTLMFSATFPNTIRKLAGRFLKDGYAFLALGIIGAANMDIDQTFYQVSGKEKKPKLLEILNREKEHNTLTGTIVFVETKMTADFLASYLLQKNFSASSIHGDRTQSQREKAIADIKDKNIDILVATNVGARGLDIEGLNHVIQYDLNNDIDFYVHRIGRTGRVGNKGRATTFYNSEKDSVIAEALVKILKQAEQPVPEFLEGSGTSYQPARTNAGIREFKNQGRNDSSNLNDEPEEEW